MAMVEFHLTYYSTLREAAHPPVESTTMNTALQENTSAPTTSPAPSNGQNNDVLNAHLETVPIAPARPSPAERLAEGKTRRHPTPRSSHADWRVPGKRIDPLDLLERSNSTRLKHLVPIRYGRMLASPFHFLRGSPIVMANDLAATPLTGISVQMCGDAHIMNFGLYASPERRLLFDVNDFDETLPGPWEFDVKRLATSCVVAGRSYGLRPNDCREAAATAVRSYRQRMHEYSRMRLLDVWYSSVDARAAQAILQRSGSAATLDLRRARRRNSLQALSKLATAVSGRLRIVDNPPLVCRIAEEGVGDVLRRLFHLYVESLQDDRRTLLERYRLVDFALKVVGVGSVGMRCYILLLDSSHAGDPLFLQLKESEASVLEPLVGKSVYANHGRRVVNGQRMMQSASDMFLGWTSDGEHDYCVRQLRDMKGAADLEHMNAAELIEYAELCGWVLSRAHARSGDPALIAGYLGRSEVFDEAIADFAEAYADQTLRDYDNFRAAVKAGRIPAELGV
jgi:uncharacterized protein (DUF2252 family)